MRDTSDLGSERGWSSNATAKRLSDVREIPIDSTVARLSILTDILKDGQQEEQKKEAIALQAMTASQMETRREAEAKEEIGMKVKYKSTTRGKGIRSEDQTAKYRSIECQAHTHMHTKGST